MSSLVALPFAWVAEALLACLLLGLALALLAGALLLARPQALFALDQRLSRSFDTRASLARLDAPVLLERLFYRHHRLLGGALTLGAAYVLWQWAFDYRRASLLALLGRPWSALELAWLVQALEWALVLLHLVILALGLVILLRPSLLKQVERRANHWVRGPSATALERPLGRVDVGFQLYPRLSGLVLVLSSGWCLAVLAPLMRALLAG